MFEFVKQEPTRTRAMRGWRCALIRWTAVRYGKPLSITASPAVSRTSARSCVVKGWGDQSAGVRPVPGLRQSSQDRCALAVAEIPPGVHPVVRVPLLAIRYVPKNPQTELVNRESDDLLVSQFEGPLAIHAG